MLPFCPVCAVSRAHLTMKSLETSTSVDSHSCSDGRRDLALDEPACDGGGWPPDAQLPPGHGADTVPAVVNAATVDTDNHPTY